MLSGYKYRINPNREQRDKISTFFDAVCFVWNHFLALKEDEYKQYKNLSDAEKNKFRWLSAFDMINMIPALKKAEDTKWLAEAPAQALQVMPTFSYGSIQTLFQKTSKET